MILKTITERKKITKVVSVKRNETYAEALARFKKLVIKELNIDGKDCEYLISKGCGGCEYCILGTPKEAAGYRCLQGRIVAMIEESERKAVSRNL